MKVNIVRIDSRCSNIECPNKVGDGDFHLVGVGEGKVVGGKRGITLLLCSPCTAGMQEAQSGEKM